MKNKKTISMLLLVAAFLVLVSILFIIFFDKKKEEDKLKVGFIMSGSMEEEGWNGMHYQGIKAACEKLNVDLVVKEGIKENTGQCEVAISELAEDDVDVIIMSSYGYAQETLEVVKEYPNIVFYSESFDYYGENLNCYFARIYQARYLSGIIAGFQTKTNSIGYVAAMPNSEVNRGINAFTLGVKRVNPEARVVVAWSNSWDDAEEEKRLAQQLIDTENVDVISYHQNQPNVVEVAEDNNIYSIGYHYVTDTVSDNVLGTVVFNWDLTYEALVGDYIKGKSKDVNTYWFGLEEEAVDVVDISPLVSENTIQEIEKAKSEILSGTRIFSGIIYDVDGNLRCNHDESIDDEILMRKMNWYVEGVEFYEE